VFSFSEASHLLGRKAEVGSVVNDVSKKINTFIFKDQEVKNTTFCEKSLTAHPNTKRSLPEDLSPKTRYFVNYSDHFPLPRSWQICKKRL